MGGWLNTLGPIHAKGFGKVVVLRPKSPVRGVWVSGIHDPAYPAALGRGVEQPTGDMDHCPAANMILDFRAQHWGP